MSAPTTMPATADAAGATAARPRRRRRWWRWAVPLVLLLAGFVLLSAIGQVLMRQAASDDPRGRTPSGMGILATLLGNHHVTVDVVDGQDRVPSDLAGTTLVVSNPLHITAADVDAWARRGASRIVVMSAGYGDTSQLGFRYLGSVTSRPLPAEPTCLEHAARRMGTIASRGPWFAPSKDWSACATGVPGAAWVQGRAGGSTRVDVVAATILRNELIDEEGNAALGMNLLGHDARVVWVMALPPDGAAGAGRGSDKPIWLLPNGLAWLAVVSPLLLLVVAVWRGKRFGPILSERLPVVVPASETVRGHGRLYARLRARDTAAASLRAASLRRLSRLLGAGDASRLAELLAVRTGGDVRTIHAILAGPPPADDAALITLKQDLDHLEQEARKL